MRKVIISTRLLAEYQYITIKRKMQLLLFWSADLYIITRITTSFIKATWDIWEVESVVHSMLNIKVVSKAVVSFAWLTIDSKSLWSKVLYSLFFIIPNSELLQSFWTFRLYWLSISYLNQNCMIKLQSFLAIIPCHQLLYLGSGTIIW